MRLIAIFGCILVSGFFSVHCDQSTLESRIIALEKSLIETKDELENTLEEISDLKKKDDTKRFLSDDEGRPIMFSAQLAPELHNLGDHQPIKFNYIISNNGSGYDFRTGVFTAPTSGNYLFIVTLMCRFRDWFEARLVRNGNFVMPIYAGSSIHFNQGTSSVIVRLDKGDKLWVETFNNAVQGNINVEVYGNRWSSFTGMRVSI